MKVVVETYSFHSTLNFEGNKLNFWRLNILFCCRATNQYSEITDIFSKILNQSTLSKG